MQSRCSAARGFRARRGRASRHYLARWGVPEIPQDLHNHNCLNFRFRRAEPVWPFRRNGVAFALKVRGAIEANSGETLGQLALDGVGIARVGNFSLGDAIAQRRLVPLLEPFNPGGQGDLPGRVRRESEHACSRPGIRGLPRGVHGRQSRTPDDQRCTAAAELDRRARQSFSRTCASLGPVQLVLRRARWAAARMGGLTARPCQLGGPELLRRFDTASTSWACANGLDSITLRGTPFAAHL